MRGGLAAVGIGRLTAASLACACLAGTAAADVRWRSGNTSRPRAMTQAALEGALAVGAPRHVVIHFDGPLDEPRRAALASSGVRLLDYLGGHAWFASVAAAVDAATAARVAGLVALEDIDPANKLHPDLAAGLVRPWSVVALAAIAGAGPTVAVYVQFHGDVEAAREAPDLLARHAGIVRSQLRSIPAVVAHLPFERVRDLAAEDAVMYVEPPLPRLQEINSENRARTGADVLQQPPHGLSGSGVAVLVYDGGKVVAHDDLAGRVTVGVGETSGFSDHATHVACTVAGDGADSGGALRGMAPAATIVSYGFEQEGGLQPGFLYTDPGDLEADYTNAIAVHGADLANNSIGSNVASNGFPCEWEGNYGVTGALIDEIARGALGTPFRIVWAGGNERGSGACGTGYGTTAPPSCAKNHITVGALYSDLDEVTWFSSWGPCDDGRLKPDVSGPGCQASADFGVTSCSATGGYNVKCGTSMSSPTVAGIAALLLEQYRASYPGREDFRGSTLKALLAHTAADRGPVGPDYQTGYGSVRAVPAAEAIVLDKFHESEVGQDGVVRYAVAVDPGTAVLKVTLAWDDPAGAPDVEPVLVNDLDLRVVDAGGGVHLPWTLDPAAPHLPAVRTQRDSRNNLEQVVVDAPPPGHYLVEVVGFDVAAGGAQSFSIVADPNLNFCSSAATFDVGATHVTCEASLPLEVVDCDANLDDAVTDTVLVHAVSGTEPAGESVMLTEVVPFVARYTGSLTLAAADEPGVLQVAHGDTVQVTYIDADDGAGGTDVQLTREVLVDCADPEITAIAVSNVTRHEARIEVATSEAVYVDVSFGTSCANRTNVVLGAIPAAQHQIDLSGLADGVTYFFAVTARDEAGNADLDDAGGACHQFTTVQVPEFFTEQFPTGFDLQSLQVTFTPTGPPDAYAACAEPLGGSLPTDPAGGTDLDLGDDAPRSFDISGGNRVRLYGAEHATVWVGPNGFLTLGQGDMTFEETLAAHFAMPRVAALFDDLHPGAAGASVSWKQLEDRVAVTWLDVPELNQGNSNTFQIEMFFDGRVRLSWLEVAAPDGIVGLSSGAGLDPDFAETDLSLAAGCGPFPPLVRDVFGTTSIAQPVAVALAASDDGLPEPASLGFRITSLPEFGTLSDPASGADLTAAPHDLEGSAVTYRPYPGFGGVDRFEFQADDGGTAPQGGPSGIAAASIGVVVGPPVAVHEFLTDDADPQWTTTGAWSFGAPAGGGSHARDPAAGATGANVYGYNLLGDYDNGMPEQTLTTPALDLGNVEGARIEFARWLGVEGAAHDHAALQISTDGASWTSIWIHAGPAISEGAWSTRSYDVSALADAQPAVSFRWVMGTTDGAVTYPGWNIDDVRIVGTLFPTCNRAPGAAEDLRFAADKRTLGWTYTPKIGEPEPRYDTLRSESFADFASAALCLEVSGVDRESEDPTVPAPGTLLVYLVRVTGDCGPGPLGTQAAPPCAP